MGGAFWIPAICFAAESLRRKDTEGESAPRRHTGSGNSWKRWCNGPPDCGIVSK
jgi:hypothetical protein